MKTRKEIIKQIQKDQEATRKYENDTHCSECGKVLPYGQFQKCEKHEVAPTSSHTPTPWHYEIVKGDSINVYSKNRDYGWVAQCGLASTNGMNEPNAAFIVRAVNAHNDLLEIAKDALCELDPDCKMDGIRWEKGMDDRQCLIIGLYEAIAKAEGR